MELTRLNLRIFTFILGPIILATYAYGVSKMSNPEKLWGGIPESWAKIQCHLHVYFCCGFYDHVVDVLVSMGKPSCWIPFLGHGNQIVKEGIIDYSFVLV